MLLALRKAAHDRCQSFRLFINNRESFRQNAASRALVAVSGDALLKHDLAAPTNSLSLGGVQREININVEEEGGAFEVRSV